MNDAQAMAYTAQAIKNASPEQLAELRDLVLTLCANEGLSQQRGPAAAAPKRVRAPRASRARTPATPQPDATPEPPAAEASGPSGR